MKDCPDTLNDIKREMARQGIGLLLAFHDGAHFIEKPNAVMVLSGFKSMGPAVVIVPREGKATLIVSPAWDLERAAECAPDFFHAGAEDIVEILGEHMPSGSESKIGIAGLAGMPSRIGERLEAIIGREPQPMDRIVFAAARCKSENQIAKARRAARVAERGYERLLEIARPGMREDELALDLKHYMKTLGAEDNFLMLCASSHNRAVQPSSGRLLERGDIVLAEITPSIEGQLAQICRTAVLGNATDTLKEGYELVVRSMAQGIAAAKAGAKMADVCAAIDSVLKARGYGEYCHPPHIRRRGHGLGFGSNWPGDVSLDNESILEPGMFFVIHPNQYLPETGYLLCGEPVLVTGDAPEVMSERPASLAEIPI